MCAALHRLGLSETLLVFAEHRVFLAGALETHLARLLRAHPEKKLVVEVADIAEAMVAAQAGAEIVQLEKFTPAQCATLAALLAPLPRRPLLAAAGGIHAGNAAAYAAADLVVTSAPYAAAPAEVQVRMLACDCARAAQGGRRQRTSAASSTISGGSVTTRLRQ